MDLIPLAGQFADLFSSLHHKVQFHNIFPLVLYKIVIFLSGIAILSADGRLEDSCGDPCMEMSDFQVSHNDHAYEIWTE